MGQERTKGSRKAQAAQTGIVWKDGTSYSRDDKQRKQTIWTAEVGPITIIILTSHVLMRGEWAYRVNPLMSEARPLLEVDDPEEVELAKVAALQETGERLAPFVDAYETIMAEADR